MALLSGHRLAGRGHLSVADVRDEAWITGHAGYPLAEAVNVVAAAAGQPLRVAHHMNEFFVAASVVATGAAIARSLARLPRFTLAPRPGPGVVLVPLREVTVARQIDVLSRPEALARASVRRVLGDLRAVAEASRLAP